MLGKHLCCPRLKPNRISKTTPPTPPINKTFNSLYESTTTDSEVPSVTRLGFWSGSTSQTLTTKDSDPGSSDSDEPDLASVFAARRLTRPVSTGMSNSIVEEDMNERLVVSKKMNAGYGPVPKMSPDPYMDFKKSMEEMVEALGIAKMEVEESWAMQELLLCYLALNRRNAHEFIVCAFADVFRDETTDCGGGIDCYGR